MIRPLPIPTCCLFAILAIVFTIIAGCGEADPVQTAKAADPQADWPTVIRIGLIPTEGGADTQQRFDPLQDHLTAQLGRPVELIAASHYQGVITAMANQQIEFAWLGPKSYVEAANRANAQALILEVSIFGDPGYHSVFIVPSESEIQSLEDARGKRFVFTDPNSTSGSLIPTLVLRDVLDTTADQFFSEVRYSGSHSTSAIQVAQGEVDVAAVGDIDLRKLLSRRTVPPESIRIIHRSDLIPGSPLAARADIPESLKAAFTDAMMMINDDPAMLERFQIGGYQPATDETYDIIRAVQAMVAQQTDP